MRCSRARIFITFESHIKYLKGQSLSANQQAIAISVVHFSPKENAPWVLSNPFGLSALGPSN